jgi:hypothetical protein
MKSCSLLLALVCMSSTLPGEAQPLAEVARKERERRAKLGTEAPVIGDAELASGEGATFSVTGTSAGGPEAGADAGEAEGESDVPKLTEREIRDLREKWYRLWREQMAAARKEIDKARDDVYQCRTAESFFFVPLAVDCDGVEVRLAEAEANLKEIQANRYNWELLVPR